MSHLQLKGVGTLAVGVSIDVDSITQGGETNITHGHTGIRNIQYLLYFQFCTQLSR